MKEIKIKAPATIDDLRIRHNKVLSDVKFQGDVTVKQMCEFVAGITGTDIVQIHRVDIQEVIRIFHHCINLFGEFKKTDKPKKKLEVNGETYYLVNPHKVASGWHIDLDSLPKEPRPTLLMAMLYIPEGVYGQLDANENIKFSLAEREKIFQEHFKLTDLFYVIGFFLNKSKKLTNGFTELSNKVNQT